MLVIDVLLRRALRRLRDALPGSTTASRLMRQSNSWRNVPPRQRPGAYAQFMHTQAQLRQVHVGQKILPKVIDVLFTGLRLHLAAPAGGLFILYLLGCLFGLW